MRGLFKCSSGPGLNGGMVGRHADNAGLEGEGGRREADEAHGSVDLPFAHSSSIRISVIARSALQMETHPSA